MFIALNSRDNDRSLKLLRGAAFRVEALSEPFAIAIANPRERSLLLARDISGEQALFVHVEDELIAFASMPGPLTAFTDAAADLQFLADSMSGVRLPSGPSCWIGIRAILPGTIELHHSSGVENHSLVDWNVPTRPLVADDPAILRQLLDQSVDAALDRAPCAALQLSSGLDSNAVLASAARRDKSAMFAVSAGPGPGHQLAAGRHRFPDETDRAARAAKIAGVEHLIFRDQSRIIDELRGASVHFHGPVPNPINLGWMNGLAKVAADQGASHMITAIQGNATLTFGGLWILPEWLRRRQVASWVKQTLAARHMPDVRWQGLVYNSVEPWLPRSLVERIVTPGRATALTSRSPFLRREWQASPAEPVPSAMNEARRWMITNYDQGQNNQAFKSMTGLSYVDPTADRALLEFSLSLPPTAFLDQGVAKPLFKQAMAGRVPDFILHEPLRGFQGADFYGRINQTEALEAVEELSASHDANQLLDFDGMRRAIAQWPAFDVQDFSALFAFVRSLTDALAVGYFLLEKDRIARPG